MTTAVANRSASPSRAVVEAVASREGIDPVSLETPLYEAIDPDALDALVRRAPPTSDRAPLHVEFTYHGYDVTVSSEGEVAVSGAVEASSSTVPDGFRSE